MKSGRKYIVMLLILATISVVFWAACTKYDNPAPVYEELGDSAQTQSGRKVLLISIDGVVGEEIKKIMPQTIKSLLPHSKYTWTGLSEYNTGDATTWATMMTGVSLNKHLILDDSFIPKTSYENAQTQIPFYPSVFYRILNTRPFLKTIAISPWAALNQSLFAHANKRITAASDLAVKDSALSEMANGNSALVLLNFMDVLHAGTAGGFTADNPDYVNAVNTVDGYIGEVMEALKSRKSFDQEDWLVIITTNHGGTGVNYGGSSDPERNIFTLFYHPEYKSVELNGEKLYNAGFNQNIAGTTDSTASYNSAALGTFTVEARIKINPFPNGSYDSGGAYPKIFGKSKWGLHRQHSQVWLFMENDSTDRLQRGLDPSFIDGKWHTLTVVMTTEPKLWRVKMYMDGALNLNVEQAKTDTSTTDNAPFTIGGTDLNFNIEEIRIWNKELNPAIIAENACMSEITPSHLEYSSLISYWRGNSRDGGSVFKNQVSGYPDIKITGPIQYTTSANNLPCGGDNLVVENTTIAPQVYYWLQIPIESSWNMDGSDILSRYEIEFDDNN